LLAIANFRAIVFDVTRRRSLSIVAPVLVVASCAHAATPELRGTWLTTTANTAIATPANTASTMQRLRAIGLNSVYTEVWKNGFTEFPSQTMQNTIGVPFRINASPGIPAQQRDLLAETLIHAHRNQLSNIAWFEYGLAAKFGNPGTASTDLAKYMADRGWLLRDASGNFTNASNGFSWMNPLVPEVRSFMKSVVLDAVKNYDLDGIQFDDRLAWPVQFGYDDYMRNAYLAETGRTLPTSASDSQFLAWRSQKVTAFAQEMISAVRAARPDIIISSSPAVHPFAYDNYAVNWPDWRARGMFDEFVPQVYRATFNDFNRDWDGQGNQTTGGQVAQMGNRRGDFAAGIAMNTSPTPAWSELQQMVNLQRNTSGVAGHVWWYSAGVLANEASLTAYYNVAANGHAARTDRPLDWRPAPTIASRVGTTSTWNVTVPADGRYRVIQRIGDTWTEVSFMVYADGQLTLNLPGAEQVELLVDRRPYLLGDANLDNRVDFADLVLLARSFNQTNTTWPRGDFSLDRVTDFADLVLLARNYNASTGGGTGTFEGDLQLVGGFIPEPASMAVLGGAAFFGLTRRRTAGTLTF
jgi:uncharacterized lipoprotein YddW (UPF0748 family)